LSSAGREEARKDDREKLRYDLVPVYPLAKLVEVYTIGAKRYAPRNWEKGTAFSRYYSALLRHLMLWWAGERDDPEDGQHHLASVAWYALALMEYEITHPEMDDRPKNPAILKALRELYEKYGGKRNDSH
jgi:hypothetical protein